MAKKDTTPKPKPKPRPRPRPRPKTQQQKQPTQTQSQGQHQTVIVNLGSTRRAPAKKSSGGSSAPPPPPPSHYAPAFFTYPIYQPGVNVPTAQPVSEARTLGAEAPQLRVTPATLASATEARLKLLEKSQKKVEPQDEGISFVEKLQQRRGVFVQPNYEKMQKPTPPSPISEMEQAAEEHLRLPPYVFRGYPEASKGKESPYSAAKRMEEEQAAISSPLASMEGAKLSLQPPEIALPENVQFVHTEQKKKYPNQVVFSQSKADAEYIRRYGQAPPSYLKEYSTNPKRKVIGMGSFLNERFPEPAPPRYEDYEAWINSMRSQKAGK